MAWHGWARQGKDRGGAWHGRAWPGPARQGHQWCKLTKRKEKKKTMEDYKTQLKVCQAINLKLESEVKMLRMKVQALRYELKTLELERELENKKRAGGIKP
jgi:hypothetical protein